MNEFSITSFNLRNSDASFLESPHVLSSHDAQDLYGPSASHAVGIDD